MTLISRAINIDRGACLYGPGNEVANLAKSKSIKALGALISADDIYISPLSELRKLPTVFYANVRFLSALS